MRSEIQEIRIYPVSREDYPTEEYIKVCIANGIEHYMTFYDLCNERGYLNLSKNTLFLFQYSGKIIAKARVSLAGRYWDNSIDSMDFSTNYITDEIEILDKEITAKDIRNIWSEFKRFNSVAQIIPRKFLPEIQELFVRCKSEKNFQLGDNESAFIIRAEGNKVEYYVTKYERNPVYREQAIKIHGLTCQICGFNYEKKYGRVGENFIEVHHKKPLFSLEGESIPNPETDMICVCSNCHRMIHRYRNSILTPEELKILLK